MKSKLSILLLTVLFSSISIFCFGWIRYPHYEEKQLTIQAAHANQLFSQFSRYFEKNAISSDKYPLVIEHMLKKDTSLALVGAVDSFNNLVHGERNQEQIPAKRTYNEIITQLLAQKTPENQLTMVMHTKYYIHPIQCDAFTLYLLYPFKLNKQLLMQFGIEALLAAAFSTALLFMLVALFTKKSGSKNSPILQEKNVLSVSNSSDESEDQKSLDSCEDDIQSTIDTICESRVIPFETKESRKVQIRNFESYVFNTFNRVAITYRVNSLSLYLLDNSSVTLKKIFELLGRAFVKTTASNSIENETSREIINALADNSTIIRKSGTKIIIPIFHESELLGAVVIKNREAITGGVVQKVKDELKQMGGYLMSEILKNAG